MIKNLRDMTGDILFSVSSLSTFNRAFSFCSFRIQHLNRSFSADSCSTQHANFHEIMWTSNTIYIHANIEGRLGLSARVPESQKLKMVDKACMALNIQMW